LARAGFIFKPVARSPDNVVCFMCHKSLDGWEAGDDPNEEHYRHSPECAWAVLHAPKDVLYGLDPSSDEIARYRLETFGTWWPHDGKRGWVPTSEALAHAGFFYSPSRAGDDLAACRYCGLVLDGWEPKDSP
ncbi:inhibitor of apoptosis repeat-containing protein, partial [Dipodascopsis tothii]|uniref:inhibitor of apoptosis repeat-containing protein n=1 Tax=Dipodascopsis tothii TaxID=44089 RepID=UPI0034CE8E51